MDTIAIIQDYISRAVSSVSGMKVLLLDQDTTGIVSTIFTQSAILQHEVFLFERLDKATRDVLAHLVAIVIVRPTADNVAWLQKELSSPKYRQYHIFFTNIVGNVLLEDIARADAANEAVKEVQEFFMDYYAVNPDLIDLHSLPIVSSTQHDARSALNRISEGVLSLLLSLKKKPIIRFQKNSDLCAEVASEVNTRIQQEQELFDMRRSETNPSVLLILDRKTDPITPLLMQWTYQAMVHELIGINKNRVVLDETSKKANNEVVLSPDTDEFYRASMFLDFGELGTSVKSLVDSLQNQQKEKQKLESIDDIKQFLDNYPQFRKHSSTVATHVTVMDRLSHIVAQRDLMSVGQCEQDTVCRAEEGDAYRAICELISRPDIHSFDKLRLASIFTLRFSDTRVHELGNLLLKSGVPNNEVDVLYTVARYSKTRGDINIFGDQSFLSKISKSMQRGIKGVENVFTEHKPYLRTQLLDLSQGRLKDTLYPVIGGGNAAAKPTEIIVFIVGGVTYEEAAMVAEINSKTNEMSSISSSSSSTGQFPKGMRIVLGGNQILNSKMFFDNMSLFK